MMTTIELESLITREGTGRISADPNPILAAAGSAACATTIRWESEDVELIEVRVDGPDGQLFTQAGPRGSATTGQWVRDGMTFFLQDVSDGRPLISDHTLAVTVVHVAVEQETISRPEVNQSPAFIAAEQARQPSDQELAPSLGQVNWGDLHRLSPISRKWGLDRGRAIDRYYIENFLARHAGDIRGHVLAVGDDGYTRLFGGAQVTHSDVLHVSAGPPVATITADLTDAPHVPSDTFDCIICPQTLQLIYDLRSALRTLHRILKPGGVLLLTLPGISQTYDDEWSSHWCWHFTTRSARLLCAEVFGAAQVEAAAHGNVLAATAFLYGLAVAELRQEELDHRDPGYDVSITVRAVKSPND